MVEALLQRGADPNLLLPEGMAPIHLAAGMEQESGIRCLALVLQYGGDPNARSVEDLTPLHVAASWGCYTCLRLLLMEGGDPRLKDQDGNTALDLALEQGNEMCVRILREPLEEEEQSSWMSHRRAESFLSTMSEDPVEARGTSRHHGPGPDLFSGTSKPSLKGNLGHSFFPLPVVAAPGGNPDGCVLPDCQDKRCSCGNRCSASFLTECSWKCTTLCDCSEFPTQLPASCRLPFDHVDGKETLNRSAGVGFPEDEPPCPKLDAYVQTTDSCSLKTTTGEGCHSSPDQKDGLPKATLISSDSQEAWVSSKISSTTGSQEILDPPFTHEINSECNRGLFLVTQNANTTLDLTQYGSFLDPGLTVKHSSQQGLDVTSPDHAFLFSRGNSTAVSDLEKTLVVDPAFLSTVCKNPDGCTKLSSFRRSSGDISSHYLSCNSDASTLEVPGCNKAEKYEEQKASFGCSPGHSNRGQSLMSQMSHGPCSSEKHVKMSPAAISPSKSQTCRETPSKTLTGQQTLGPTGKNGCPGNVREPVFSVMCPWQNWGNHDLNTIQLQEPPNLVTLRAANQVLPEDSTVGSSEQIAAHELQGEFGDTASSSMQMELNEETAGRVQRSGVLEKAESLETQDTVLIQRTPEKMRAFLDAEIPISPETSEDADDTMPVSHPSASVVKEEALSSLDVKLRSMMLATKACHSPLLQPKQGSYHVPPNTKSLTATSARHNDSSSSSLFDEALEMPRRPRRVRSPEGRAPRSKEACHCPMGPPQMAGGEAQLLDNTHLVPAGPSICKPPSHPGSILLGPIVTDLAEQTKSGRDDCRDQYHLEVKSGSCCSADSEVKSPPKEVRPSLDNRGEHNTTSEETCAPPSWTDTKHSSARHAKGKRSPKPFRVSFSRLSVQGSSFTPGAASCPPRRLSPIGQVVPLSPGGRPLNVSATEPVEYLYVDEDEGHTLVERHVPCTDDSVANTTSSEDTVIYDWRAYANQAAGLRNKGKSSLQLPPELYGHLSDQALFQRLRDLGVNPGPITDLTRKLYMQLLEKLMSDPKTKPRKDSAGYSPELTFALETYQIPDSKDDEMALARQFDQPDKNKKWREGLLKSSFNYLLLDPRVTQNLPFRCQYVSQAECFRTFISAIFYVGKGKRSRPYSHLYEALTCYKGRQRKRGRQTCSKVQHILEIWASGQGVISMHCFQNVIPVEAFTREACMVDAVGLKMLTNQKKGNYYGLVAGWPMKRRRQLGIYLLHRAMQIFLAEGERQLRPADIQPGR
ncbi:ankyrin repeat and LEM domain-containing protein 1 isoform X2 [Sceloporus undulatus]|nr:ankyrin repeat and LEM domain-containing protein 1 isoform X2 [Sceloporus undulatus]